MSDMVRRDDYGELNKWIYQPRVLEGYNIRTQIFSKV